MEVACYILLGLGVIVGAACVLARMLRNHVSCQQEAKETDEPCIIVDSAAFFLTQCKLAGVDPVEVINSIKKETNHE